MKNNLMTVESKTKLFNNLPEIGEATYDRRGSKSLTKNKPLSSLGQEPLVTTDRYASSMPLASPVLMNLLHIILHRPLYFSGQKSCQEKSDQT